MAGYYQKKCEKIKASVKKYQQRPEVKKQNNKRDKLKRRTNTNFRLAANLRSRLYHALKGKIKSARTVELLGCSVDHLKEHLEKQFQPGMTWDNKRDWHVDHMVACACFDLSSAAEQHQCFHYTNLQPMWALENQSKGAKELYNRTWIGTQWIDSQKSALTTLASFETKAEHGII